MLKVGNPVAKNTLTGDLATFGGATAAAFGTDFIDGLPVVNSLNPNIQDAVIGGTALITAMSVKGSDPVAKGLKAFGFTLAAARTIRAVKRNFMPAAGQNNWLSRGMNSFVPRSIRTSTQQPLAALGAASQEPANPFRQAMTARA